MKKQQLIQAFGDVLIPLLGFFIWEWSLYFIVLFYLLDYTVSEVVTFFKARKIIVYTDKGRTTLQKMAPISGLLFVFTITTVHLALYGIHPGIHFLEEVIRFLSEKDLGIPQGIVLLPLLAFVGWQRYKMEFVIPMKFRNASQSKLWRDHLYVHLTIALCSILVFGLTCIFPIPEQIYLFLLLSGTLVFNLFFRS